jgi:hypothetical protein
MAGIDYTIPGQFKGIQIESPMNAMTQAMQLRNLQETSQMNALKRQEAQEMTRQRNALATYLANPKKPTDPMELEAGVRQTAPLLADQFIETQLKREDLGFRIEERKAKTGETKIKAEERERTLSREKIETAIADITSFDTVGAVLSDINRKVESGELQQDQADKIIAGMPDNDAEIPAWQIRTVRSLLSAKDRIADVRAEKKDVREEKRIKNEEARLKLEDARIQEQTRHANAMEANARKGADRAEADLKEKIRHNQAMERLRRAEINKPSAIAAPTVTMVLDPNDSTRMLSVDAKTYRGGTVGSPGVIGIAGKEPTVGAKQADRETAQENAGTAIAQLRQSFDQLDKLGGITSTQNRAGTNVMAGLSSSGVGQFTGRLFGTEAQSQRNQIAQTRPLLMTSIMKAMGLSAKQLDSNAELKLWLSAATDPTLDIQSNKAALDNLEQMLTGKGKDKPAPKPTAPKPKTDIQRRAEQIIQEMP